MNKSRYLTLNAYLENQEEIIDDIFKKIEKLELLDEDKAIHLGYLMHNLYSALEDLFKEISHSFENNIDRDQGYHKNILLRMKIEIPGIRPAVISKQTFEILTELMAFRHVFRHTYNYSLSVEKLSTLKHTMVKGKNNIAEDIKKFKSLLTEKAEMDNEE